MQPTTLSGFYTAYRTGNTQAALQVAIWGGLIGGAMALVTIMGMTALFLDALRSREAAAKASPNTSISRRWRAA